MYYFLIQHQSSGWLYWTQLNIGRYNDYCGTYLIRGIVNSLMIVAIDLPFQIIQKWVIYEEVVGLRLAV